MHGGGGDADGRFTIQDGFCARDGKAYWKEIGPGTNVSNAGIFDFKLHTFKGTWLAQHNQRGGDYIEFYHTTRGSPRGQQKDAYQPPPSAPAVAAGPAAGDVEQGSSSKPPSSLVGGSSLITEKHGVYMPPPFAQAATQSQNSREQQPKQEAVGPKVTQPLAYASGTTQQTTISGYSGGTYVLPPPASVGYVSSVSSSEAEMGLSAPESLSSSYGYHIRPQRNIPHPPPSAPPEEQVKKP